MKTFKQFIKEASFASLQAKRFGYVGDGHGGWYNRATGEFEAKTVGGQLKFYNKNQIIGGKDPKQNEFDKNIPLGSTYPFQPKPQSVPTPPQNAQIQPSADQPNSQGNQVAPNNNSTGPKTKGNVTIVFGRFNPPTVGHTQILDTASNLSAENGDEYIIVPSRSQDSKKDPLDPDTKISFMRLMYPNHSERIVNDSNLITIFDVLKKLNNDGYTSVKIVSGPDRIKEFEKLANNYNGQLYQFDNIEVIPSGEYDPDGKDMNQLSAARLRLAAAEGDFATFRQGLPSEIKNKDALNIFNSVRQGMNIQEIQKEGYQVWEIAPDLDLKSLRENYISHNIFKEGEYIESLNTGLVGKIIRRGTNYLICVTESGMMFKSWIKDVKESYTEKQMNSIERVKNKPNTLVGTVGYFKYAAKMTPGAIGTGSENLQAGGTPYGINLINKNIKSKK